MQKQRASAASLGHGAGTARGSRELQEEGDRDPQGSKELRKNLRVESDALQFWTKVRQYRADPALVVLLGIGLAVARRRKAVTK